MFSALQDNCVLSFIDYYYTCSSSVIQFKISVRLKSTKAKKHLAFYFSAIRSLQYCSTVDIVREKSSFNPLFHLFFPILWFQNRTVGFITNQQSHSCIFNIYYFENIASFFERRYTQYWFILIPSLCECSAKDLRLLSSHFSTFYTCYQFIPFGQSVFLLYYTWCHIWYQLCKNHRFLQNKTAAPHPSPLRKSRSSLPCDLFPCILELMIIFFNFSCFLFRKWYNET